MERPVELERLRLRQPDDATSAAGEAAAAALSAASGGAATTAAFGRRRRRRRFAATAAPAAAGLQHVERALAAIGRRPLRCHGGQRQDAPPTEAQWHLVAQACRSVAKEETIRVLALVPHRRLHPLPCLRRPPGCPELATELGVKIPKVGDATARLRALAFGLKASQIASTLLLTPLQCLCSGASVRPCVMIPTTDADIDGPGSRT